MGRKKSKGVSDEQVTTPRTRAVAAREGAAETQVQPSQTSSLDQSLGGKHHYALFIVL